MMKGATRNVEELLERVRQAVQAHTKLDVANFQYIGLDDIRRAYGEKWPERKKKIFSTSEAFLSKRLTDSDILIPGDRGFVVIFAGGAPPDGAAAHAETLARGLNTFILGELHDPLGPQAKVETKTVDAAEFARSLEKTHAPPSAEADKLAPMEDADDKAPARWLYQPLWNVSREALTGYYATPVMRETGLAAPGYLNDKTSYARDFFKTLDLEALRQSEDLLQNMIASGKRALVGASVHVNTLAAPDARAKVLTLLSGFDDRLTKYRILKISSVPAGYPSHYLEEIIRFLQRKASNIAVTLSPEATNVEQIAKMNITALGLGLPAGVRRRDIDLTPATSNAIRHLATTCRSRKIISYVEGEFGAQNAVRMCAKGVDILISPRIWPLQSEVEGVVLWPANRLMSAGCGI